MTMHLALIVVYALAVARVTRLVVEDRITEAPRERLARWLWARSIPKLDVSRRQPREPHLPEREIRRIIAREWSTAGAEPPLSVYLLSCPWCASIYVAAVAAPLAYFWGASPWLLVPALALAFSYVTGFLAGKE